MSKAKLYQKLLRATQKFDDVIKESKNPFFKSTYANLNSILEAVTPALNAEGLLLLQPTRVDASGLNVVSTQIIDTETGEMIESSLGMPSSIIDPQKVIAGTTYYRRGTLKAALGLQELDDDGNFTAGKVEKLETESKAKYSSVKSGPVLAETVKTNEAPVNGGWKRPLGKTNGVVPGSIPAVISNDEVKKMKVWDDA